MIFLTFLNQNLRKFDLKDLKISIFSMAIIITINNTIKDIIKTIVRAYPKSGEIKCFFLLLFKRSSRLA